MSRTCFLDLETDQDGRILDIGCFASDGGTFHKNHLTELAVFVSRYDYICGHNILKHDLPALRNVLGPGFLADKQVIDTLYLSPLLFPQNPYHKLVKDEKLITEELNNPVNDAKKCGRLFEDECDAFLRLPDPLKGLYQELLSHTPQFSAFFNYSNYPTRSAPSRISEFVSTFFVGKICSESPLERLAAENPIALAYALALLQSEKSSVTPPWVLHHFPEVEDVLYLLRGKPCLPGCTYCHLALDSVRALKRFFGYENFRRYGHEPLQEDAVRAALDGLSLLAVFPTGGGKSITFQVPALMAGENERALTVIISPLQSLMKDQVDNLEKKGITDAVTINGLLDPIERSKAIERVMNGSAHILYISPESLRSVTIERLLLGRKIARFVVDEAHCFSSWGQDFRVDYLYIGDFIRQLQDKKGNGIRIPVSCFTATAKQKVIEDIRAYFQEKLGLQLQLFRTHASRTNLHYRVFNKTGDEEKYAEVRRLIESRDCPTIIYVSRTKKALQLAQKLTEDGFLALPYHGKMDKEEKIKNQNAFMAGEVKIMVATSAFGMGVDKSDVGMVIHYEISDSLENYVQEAGRAGRDETISADCYVLFNEEDLDKHFLLLNQTKLGIKEINQVWRAVKDLTRYRARMQHSPLEIARKAGWDESVRDVETRITTAIAALEDAGYVKRGQNMPQVFANSILAKNAQEAIEQINRSTRIATAADKEKAIRIIKKLFSSKSKRLSTDEAAESRVDYISDVLGIPKNEVIRIIEWLRQEGILANAKDLTAFIRKTETSKSAQSTLEQFAAIERFLAGELKEGEAVYNLKELNDHALAAGCAKTTPARLKTLLNLWVIRQWIQRKHQEFSKNHVAIKLEKSSRALLEQLTRRMALARYLIDYLHGRALELDTSEKEEVLLEFSVLELMEAASILPGFVGQKPSDQEVEDCLFYLSRIEALKLEGGFLVVYNRLTIDRLEQNNKIQYKQEDYRKLEEFYRNKMQQIHIVGEYARKMAENEREAQQFVDDYFRLNYPSFIRKYFKGKREEELGLNITPAKFRQLFGQLSPEQLAIIRDKTRHLVVAAGPGSGKTRVLVHKLASLLLMEDVRHEQLLMLTFSRAAATEFKKRLLDLIVNAAHFVEIKTFHSYCFDLLGKMGNLTDSDKIIQATVEAIRAGEIEPARITKTVLVVDEAQDMNAQEFELVKALLQKNDDLRIILVGDDDQNIYEFRGASSAYMTALVREQEAKLYELVQNYRSLPNLIDFSNEWLKRIPNRLKHTPIFSKAEGKGQLQVVEYRATNLVTPVVQAILTADLSGTTCVLTQTNEEAEAIVGLLTHEGQPARLIQSNEGFRLNDLAELRYFTAQATAQADSPIISEEDWQGAKARLAEVYATSNKLPACQTLIADFEAVNAQRKYKSDWNAFLFESKLEDFVRINGETIFVSTIHKAKGKEFDNVFLVLSRFNLADQQCLRQFYVAVTRAKSQLQVHYTGSFLRDIVVDELDYGVDTAEYPEPPYLSFTLSHKDVWLGFFEGQQSAVALLRSGQALQLTPEGMAQQGRTILRFSQRFKAHLAGYLNRGFQLRQGKVNYVVYWKDGEGRELQVVLPEVGCGR